MSVLKIATPTPNTPTDASHQATALAGSRAARSRQATSTATTAQPSTATLVYRLNVAASTESAEPAPAAGVQAQAGQRAIEQRSQPDEAERLEHHGEVRVARILLADPPACRQLHPLDGAAAQ